MNVKSIALKMPRFAMDGQQPYANQLAGRTIKSVEHRKAPSDLRCSGRTFHVCDDVGKSGLRLVLMSSEENEPTGEIDEGCVPIKLPKTRRKTLI